MKTRIEQITPKLAGRILDECWKKDRQRVPSVSVVSSYARAMRAGQWILTHQGIAIDDQKELVDGVHRLLAVIESGTTVPMMLTTEIPHNGAQEGTLVIDAIDRGRERSVGQQLKLRHGAVNGDLVAAVCRGVLWMCAASEKLMIGKFNVGNALRVMDVYGSEIRYVLEHRSRDHKVRNSTVAAAAAFAMKACPVDVKDFYSKLATGEEIKSGDPAMTCRRWLMNSADKPGTLIEYRGVLTCAMKHVLKEKLTKVYDTEHGYNFFLEKQRQTAKKTLLSCGFAL